MENKEKVRKILIDYMAAKIDQEDFVLKDFLTQFPIFDNKVLSRFPDFSIMNNRVPIDLVKDVLPQCCKIQHLALETNHPMDMILSTLNPKLKLKTLNIWDFRYRHRDPNTPRNCPETDLFVNMYFNPKLCKQEELLTMLRAIVKYCQHAERRTCLYLEYQPVDTNLNFELSTIFQNGLHGLHLRFISSNASVVCNHDIPPCPSIRHFSLKSTEKANIVLTALRKAIQEGHLPSLNYLSFDDCPFGTEGILNSLFPSESPDLKHLHIEDVRLNESDLQFITKLETLHSLVLTSISQIPTQVLFQNSWPNLTSLTVDTMTGTGLVETVNEGKLPNLAELMMSAGDELMKESATQKVFLQDLKGEKLPHMKKLTLFGLMISKEQLESLAENVAIWDLKYLDMSHNPDIGGNLSLFFGHRFRSLETVVLRGCGLNSDDMRCLGKAQVNLPKLKELNLSQNDTDDRSLSLLLSNRFPSLEILHLSSCGLHSDDDEHSLCREQDNLPKLKILNVCGNDMDNRSLPLLLSHRFPSLETLDLSNWSLNSNDMRCLTEAREQGTLPKLKCVDVKCNRRVKNSKKCFQNEIWRGVRTTLCATNSKCDDSSESDDSF